MKRILFIMLAVGFGWQAGAQQLNTSSLYELQGLFHNPATAGTYAPRISWRRLSYTMEQLYGRSTYCYRFWIF